MSGLYVHSVQSDHIARLQQTNLLPNNELLSIENKKMCLLPANKSFSNNSLSLVHSFYKEFRGKRVVRTVPWFVQVAYMWSIIKVLFTQLNREKTGLWYVATKRKVWNMNLTTHRVYFFHHGFTSSLKPFMQARDSAVIRRNSSQTVCHRGTRRRTFPGPLQRTIWFCCA